MNKEQEILNWINYVSKVRPELNGFAICPFAAKSKYKFVEASIDDLLPIEGYEVIIYILDDNLTLDEIQSWVEHYNEKYPDWKFFEDCKFYPTYINGVQTNNDQYNLILTQPKEKLRRFREQLAKTGYYKQWDENYLKKFLGMIMELLNETKLTPFNLNIRHTRTQHNGTVEVLVSFGHEEPAWIPMRSVEAMCQFIEEKLADNK